MVFGFVVGGDSDGFAAFVERGALDEGDDVADDALAGISLGGADDMDDDFRVCSGFKSVAPAL